MKVIFAAGGTGGHVFPAIAVADAMRELDPDVEIMFVGSTHGMEKQWVEKAGYRFEIIDVRFIKGTSAAEKLKALFMLPKCARQCKKLLKAEKPDLVIGSGGYVSGPMVGMASMSHIPTAIMEQNAIPGLTNRILSRFVRKIFVSFDVPYPFSKEKIIVYGNPVRQVAKKGDTVRERREGKLNILVFGGSQGAAALNAGVPKALKALDPALADRLSVWHQAGRGKVEDTVAAYDDCPCEHEISEFIDDMGSAYAWADLLICRAGATSLAEIKVAGKASILVPFPYAAHNHQEKNADAMVSCGASWKILNSELESDKLSKLLAECIENPDMIREKSEAALREAQPNAARDVAQYCLDGKV